MIRTSLLSIGLAAASLPLLSGVATAQEVRLAPPAGYLMSAELVNGSNLEALLWDTALGKLAKDDLMADVIRDATARYRTRTARLEELEAQAKALGASAELEEEVQRMAALAAELSFESLQVYLYFDEAQDEEVGMLAIVEPTEASAEAWNELIDEALTSIEKSDNAKALAASKVLDFDCRAFEPKDASFESMWVLRTGVQTVIGVGPKGLPARLTKAEGPSAMAASTARVVRHGGVAFHFDLTRMGEVVRNNRDADAEMKEELGPVLDALGLDAKRLSWGLDLDGLHLRHNMFLELPSGNRGLIAALTTASDTAPHIPLPAPALLQWRGSVDLEKAFDAFRKAALAANEDDPFEDAEGPIQPADLTATFPGGMAFGLSGPAAGSMVPRMAMAVNVTSAEAFGKFREKLAEVLEGIELSDYTYRDVSWTSVEIPNNPAPLVPSFALMGNMLLIGENPATVKQMIRATLEGDVGAPIDVTAGPSPLPGELLAQFSEQGTAPEPNLTFDVAAMYSMMIERYLPMVQLGLGMTMQQMGRGDEPLYTADDLPDPEELAPHLGVGTGGMLSTPEGLYVSIASSMGDPLIAAIGGMYAPLAGDVMAMGMDAAISNAEMRVGKKRLEQVWSGLRTWRTSFGSGSQLPRDLGELLTRALVDDLDVFLAPGDDAPSEMEYEDAEGEIQTFPCSYTYRPDGKIKAEKGELRFWDDMNVVGDLVFDFPMRDTGDGSPADKVAIVLYETNPGPRKGRLVVTEEGGVYHIPESTFQEMLGGR